MRPRTSLILATVLAASAILRLSPASRAEEAPPTAAPWTFETVWYRGEKRPSLIKAYAASGTLTVSDSAVGFHADKLDLHIPIVAIRDISMGKMKGDGYNEWAIVEYDESGTRKSVGFKDGKGLGGGPNTVALHDALRRVMHNTPAPAESTGTTPPKGLATPAPQDLRRDIARGFPPAPNELLTDPTTMGLLLVDGDLKTGLYAFGLDGVVLARPGDPVTYFQAGPATGRGLGEVVLFTGLEPGDYVVRMVRGSSGQGWASLGIPEGPDNTIHIEAGKVQYLGRLRFKDKGRNPTAVEKESDPPREMKIWTRFAEKYPGTTWAKLAEERARGLQGQ